MQRKDSLMVIGAAIGDVTVMPAPKNLPAPRPWSASACPPAATR